MTRVGYVGNFGPPHSTENHIAASFEAEGHEVIRYQENDLGEWHHLAADVDPAFDLILWTRTGWDPPVPHDLQLAFLTRARVAGVPVVGVHLDRWWGLERQHQVTDEPFFRSDLVITADGGHDAEWAAADVNHAWLPPAVFHAEAEKLGTPRHQFASDVAFVGSWQHYHPEWGYRLELVQWLQRTFRQRVKLWPRGGRSVRGQALADLYASVKVVVGDSCLAPAVDGSPIRNYWSDRIPETLGRRALLIHPWVAGVEEHFTDGEHLRFYPLGDFTELRRLIEHYIRNDGERRRIAAAGRAHVLEHHTYRRRSRQILNLTTALTGWGDRVSV